MKLQEWKMSDKKSERGSLLLEALRCKNSLLIFKLTLPHPRAHLCPISPIRQWLSKQWEAKRTMPTDFEHTTDDGKEKKKEKWNRCPMSWKPTISPCGEIKIERLSKVQKWGSRWRLFTLQPMTQQYPMLVGSKSVFQLDNDRNKLLVPMLVSSDPGVTSDPIISYNVIEAVINGKEAKTRAEQNSHTK